VRDAKLGSDSNLIDSNELHEIQGSTPPPYSKGPFQSEIFELPTGVVPATEKDTDLSPVELEGSRAYPGGAPYRQPESDRL
jgi:hypothetical protein